MIYDNAGNKLNILQLYAEHDIVTAINLGTATLCKKKAFVQTLSKAFDKNELFLTEYNCFNARLPVTVGLPKKFRKDSVVLTAALFLLIKNTDSVSRRIRQLVLNEVYSVQKSVRWGYFDAYRMATSANSPEIAFGHSVDVGDMELISLNLIYKSLSDEKEPIELFENHFRRIRFYCGSDKVDEKLVTMVREDSENFIGADKEFSDCLHRVGAEKIESVMDICLSEDGTVLTLLPYELEWKAFMTGGTDLSQICGRGTLVSKSDAERIAECIGSSVCEVSPASQRNSLLPKNRCSRSDEQQAVFSHGSDCAGRREQISDFYCMGLMLLNVSRFLSREILENLKTEMFGGQKEQDLLKSRANKIAKISQRVRELETKAEEIQTGVDSALEKRMRLSEKKESALQAQVRERDAIIKALNDRISELERALETGGNGTIQAKENACASLTDTEDAQPIIDSADFIEDTVDYGAILKKLSGETRILVIGGNQNLVKRLRVLFPAIGFIGDERIGNCDAAIRHAEFVFFKVDSISHSLYGKAKDIAQSVGVNIGYIPATTSTSVIEKCIAEKIMSTKGGN